MMRVNHDYDRDGARLLAQSGGDLLSVIQRKIVFSNDFTNFGPGVQQRLTDFKQRYNDTARPSPWKFTLADLDDLLTRIDQHQQRAASRGGSRLATVGQR